MGLLAHKTGLQSDKRQNFLAGHSRFDNSGRAGEANWVKEGQVDRTKEVLRMISTTVR